MLGFLSRLFRRGTSIIKDPYLGKLRYIESENGPVWAGAVAPSDQHERVEFFIESAEKILKHESRNALLDILENYYNILSTIDQGLIHEYPMQAGEEVVLQFLHIPAPNDRYEGEFICVCGDFSFSSIIHELKVVELVPHED